MAELQPYVLRSWEAEFPALGHTPAGGGPRVYRPADVELVLRIKQLVFGEGLTLAGARRRLEEEAQSGEAPPPLVDEFMGASARERLRQVRCGLEAILSLVSREVEGGQAPELTLVAQPGAESTRATSGRTARRRRASA